MNRIFTRYLLSVLLTVTLAAVAVYFALSYWFGNPFEEIARKQSAAQIFLLEQYIDQAPGDEWLDRLNKVRAVSNLKIDIVPMNAAKTSLSEDQALQLQKGLLVLDIPNKSFYRRVDLVGERYVGSEEDVIRVTGLPIDVGLTVRMELFRYAIVALFLLVPLFVWSRLHWKELRKLMDAANQYGEGQFTHRVDMQPTAMMYSLAGCMNTMAQRIDSLVKSHTTLLHSVSHELRTPIARMEFEVEFLRDASSDRDFQAKLDDMQANLTELNDLVDELLDLSKLDQQKAIHRTEFSVSELVQNLRHATDHELSDKDFIVSGENIPELLRADFRLLNRTLSNLIINAAKYGKSLVHLSIRVLDNHRFEFAVEDDGDGIPDAEVDRIFEPFYRIDQSRGRETGGIGLGLAIAQKAVQLHGGMVKVTHSEVGGAKFYFVIENSQ